MTENLATGRRTHPRVTKTVASANPAPADPATVTVAAATRAVTGEWDARAGSDPRSAAHEAWLDLVTRFSAYCRATGVRRLAAVDEAVCIGWIEAPLSAKSNRAVRKHGGNAAGQRPSDSTRSNRRACLRGFFRTARALGLYEGDPTLDIVLPPRSNRTPRALTDADVQRVRDTCRYTPHLTLLPAAVALTLASATTGEMACIRVRDLYLLEARVWLHAEQGGRHHRWGALDDWAVEALSRRLCDLRRRHDYSPDMLIVYNGNPAKPVADRTAATAMHLRRALTTAGITRPDAIPLSFQDYLATKILADTGRIEAVASRLGLRGLDRAADLAGYDWRDGYGICPRTADAPLGDVARTGDAPSSPTCPPTTSATEPSSTSTARPAA